VDEHGNMYVLSVSLSAPIQDQNCIKREQVKEQR
jgi:hypothetical protein